MLVFILQTNSPCLCYLTDYIYLLLNRVSLQKNLFSKNQFLIFYTIFLYIQYILFFINNMNSLIPYIVIYFFLFSFKYIFNHCYILLNVIKQIYLFIVIEIIYCFNSSIYFFVFNILFNRIFYNRGFYLFSFKLIH